MSKSLLALPYVILQTRSIILYSIVETVNVGEICSSHWRDPSPKQLRIPAVERFHFFFFFLLPVANDHFHFAPITPLCRLPSWRTR